MNPFLTIQRKPIRRRPPKRKPGVDDPEYREYILGLPCAACWAAPYRRFASGEVSLRYVQLCAHGTTMGQQSRTELHHAGDHAYGVRAPDRTGIPLCGEEHHREGEHSVHKMGLEFYPYHGLDRDILIRRLNEEFDAR
jgi:hypothetical protein